MSISIPFFGMNTEPIVRIEYVLIATNTTTGGSKAIIKYDLDGNEIASATYTQVGAAAAWRPRIIYSETDDSDFYYCCGDATSARITKFNKDLTIATQSVLIGSSPEIIVAGKNMPIFTSSTGGYAIRSKTDFTQTGAVGASTADRKVWYRLSKIGEAPPVLAYITSNDGMRVLTTNAAVSSYNNVWTNNNVDYDSTLLLHNKINNQAAITDTNGGSYFSDILQSTRSALINFVGTLRFGSFFSNADVLYYDSGDADIIKRTWSNVINNSSTNEWTINLPGVVWLDIDSDDNFYVATTATTNNFRKYNSSGTLLWQKTSVASTGNYGGGLSHK